MSLVSMHAASFGEAEADYSAIQDNLNTRYAGILKP